MGSTNYLGKSKLYRTKSGSSGGSDREMNGKFRRTKIKRPSKMGEYGLKRIPDYTELAYKEAVSKLKYFLSGNSAPSVRSYGSYKEEDDDKKYHTLAEYKPKPRLTAKYTSLYADSLNNYTPPVPPQNNAPAPNADATNPDVVHFIQKQEEYIEQLERESQYCRDELNNLLGKVKEVISENEHLHEAQKNKIISRMFHNNYEGSETDDVDDSTGLDSDNKVTPLKSRKARPRSAKLEGPNIVFESRIAELEAQLTQSKIDLKKVQDENNENKRKLAAGLVDSTCLDGFKRQIDNLQRDKSTLESQISKLKLNLDQRDGDLDNRHKRGSDIIEQQLREERNNLEAELRRLKEELASERNKIRELSGAGARRAMQERSAAELRHNAHTEQLARDLAAQYELAAKLELDLDRQRRDENDLKREITMKNAAIEELKIELKNKSATLQADLAQANAEKASLEEELASARLALERQQRQARHDTNRLNSEIHSLRQRLDRADADLVHSRRENLRLSEQISTLEKELNMKNLTPMPSENKKDKELSSMLESMENKHAKTVAELETMIHSQNTLMEKLTGECRSLTDKLDDANRRHKEELATLQRQIRDLSQSLQKPSHPSTYQARTPHIPAADRTSASPTSARFEHPRAEPPRHTPLGENHGLGDKLNRYDEVKPVTPQNTDNNDQYHTETAQNYRNPDDNNQYHTEENQDYQNLANSQYHVEPTQGYENSGDNQYHTETEQGYHNPEDNSQHHTESEQAYQTPSTNNEYHTESQDYQNPNDNSQYHTEIAQDYQNPNVSHHQAEIAEKYDDPNKLDSKEASKVEQPTKNLSRKVSQESLKYNNGVRKQSNEFVENKNVEPTYTADKEPNEHTELNQPEQYEQNYEQPQYTEQYENYDQYQQEYVDPNAQYNQYENYQTDGSYAEQNPENYNQEYTPEVTQPNYDTTQYNQEYNEYETQNVHDSAPTDISKS
ncbi:nuclear-pore anchor [Aricia agestis]|uniref:nuclear-pore anchor n=1 Tax=Aricia agestis TaxID=91739 RepID=UPI001C201AAF|nr:nuclear-pore anchor [Aricia agestis]